MSEKYTEWFILITNSENYSNHLHILFYICSLIGMHFNFNSVKFHCFIFISNSVLDRKHHYWLLKRQVSLSKKKTCLFSDVSVFTHVLLLIHTLMSLINVRSWITIQVDKLSIRNKRTGQKSSATGVIFSEKCINLSWMVAFFPQKSNLTGMSPIKIGGLSLVIL